MSRARSLARAFLDATWIDPVEAGRRLDEAATRAPRGHRHHLICSMIACFFITWPIFFVELCGLPLLINSLVRLRYTRRSLRDVILQPHVVLLVAWLGWGLISLAWSDDPRAGLLELASLRWFLLIPLIWPSIRHRRVLLLCLLSGILAGNSSQVFHMAGARLELPWLRFSAMPDRNPGWWPPVAAGVILCGALGMHLSAMFLPSIRPRWQDVIIVGVTLWGILATGTRGAWVVGGVMSAAAGAAAIVRVIRHRRGWKPVRMIALAGVGVGAVAMVTVGPILSQRASSAAREVRGAIERGEYETPAGARVLMARAAIDAFLARPIHGVGAGGFRSSMLDEAARLGVRDPAAAFGTHDHAHCLPLHVAATGGGVGLALAAAFVVVIIRGALRRPTADLREYAYAPAAAIVGVVLAGAFDVPHVNDQTSAFLAMVVAMAPPVRPTRADAATVRA